MISLRKKIIMIAVAFVAVVAIVTAIFACNGSSDNGTGGIPKDRYKVTVTFDAGFGQINGKELYEVKIDKGATVDRPSEIPQRNGYAFWGWNTTGDVSDPMWLFDVEKIEQDMTIHAVWIKEFTVTFYGGEGEFDDGDNVYSVTTVYGNKISEPRLTSTDPIMELQCWKTDTNKKWNFSDDAVYDDIRLYADWDIKKDIKNALAPFTYFKTDDGYRINGVADNKVVTLTVPSIITSISASAFAFCHDLTSIIIEDGVTYIGDYAFQSCDKLKNVVLPTGLTSIGEYAFSGCKALEEIRLPDTVTELGKCAFERCSSLKSIAIPNGVTEVKYWTFGECTALGRVTLGDNLTVIGDYAFRYCTALADINIPASVEEIGGSAFDGCTALESVTVPAACTAASSAFKNCTGLISAELHCETICIAMFINCTALTDVTLGDEVRTIETGAFAQCKGLKEIVIPDGVTTLEDGAFIGCSDLRSVAIGDGIETLDNNLFINCYNLRRVTIGNGVKDIRTKAFNKCISLLSITIPSSVETIAEDAFYGCYKLVEVYNLSQASLADIGISASRLTVHTDAEEESIIHDTQDGFSFSVVKDLADPYEPTLFLMDYWGDCTDAVLPDNYNGDDYKIFRYALAYKPKLQSVKFSAGVTCIYDEVLTGSDNVTSLTVDGANTVYSSSGNCVIDTSEKKFVLGCKTSVMPTDGSVTKIGRGVFCRNATMTRFIIPDTVTEVEYGAFSDCYGIMRTVDHIMYVDKWAVGFIVYEGYDKIDLQFESGTVGIADDVFLNKACIRSVTFNDEMKYIGNAAFFCCDELTTVKFNDGLVSIGVYAFFACDKLQEAVLPNTVTQIGDCAFMHCVALAYVKLPAGLTDIREQILYGCAMLQAVVIPQSVLQIRYNMIENCPDTVKIYYWGSEQQWNAIDIDYGEDSVLTAATKYYYSDTKIDGVNCWHYGADGKPTTEYN